MKKNFLQRILLVACIISHSAMLFSAEPLRIRKILLRNIMPKPIEVKIEFIGRDDKVWYLKKGTSNFIALSTFPEESIVLKQPAISSGIATIRVTAYTKEGKITKELDYRNFTARSKQSLEFTIRKDIATKKPSIAVEEWKNTRKVNDWDESVTLASDEKFENISGKKPRRIQKPTDYRLF